MIAIGHTAVGVIIGTAANQILGQGDLVTGLVITGVAGVAVHYITDFFPHGHFVKPEKLKEVLLPIIIFDLILPIILFLGLIYAKDGLGSRFLYLLFSIGGTQLPDVLDGLVFINIIKNKGFIKAENNFHQGLHWHGQGSKTLLLGSRDFWQILLILTAFFML